MSTKSTPTARGGFDLATAPNLKAADEDGHTFQVLDPYDEPMWYEDADGTEKPVTWTVCGEFSKTYEAIDKRQTRRLIKNARRGVEATPEDVEANGLEKLVGCTKAWDGFFSGGAVFACTPENVRAVLTSPGGPHIKRQVEQHIRSRGNPTPAPSAD